MGTERLLRELARNSALEPFRDLVRTLRVYFAAGANASEAADRLFLHRNSILYRPARTQKLTGLDLKEPGTRLSLQLGLLAIDAEERSFEDEAEHP